VTSTDRLAALEAAYLAAREAHDRFDVARATGTPADPADLAELVRRAGEASDAVRAALAAFDPVAVDGLAPVDRQALDRIRDGLPARDPDSPPVGQLEAAYAAAADTLEVSDAVLSRPQVLGRLGTEPDPDRRRELFLALAPLWRVVDGDDEGGAPYLALIREASQEARRGRSRLAANAAGLGVGTGEIRSWAEGVLEAWRDAVVAPARAAGEPPVEPWDWWWLAGAVQRAVGPIPVDDIIEINRAVYASLGADVGKLRIRFDITPRSGRPPVPVAFTTFGGRPHRRADGSWSPGRPTILATYVDGGLGELAELIHETGHAIHIAGIRTRPAFADWPDADALTEAIADIVAGNVADPSWLRHWLPGHPVVPPEIAARCHYAGVVMDAAWALVRDADARRPDTSTQRCLDGSDHHLAWRRGSPGMVVVGDPWPAGRGTGIHGQLRSGGRAGGGAAGGDSRRARRLGAR
jgi:hypothetical protein